jgi:EAL domain-containing protein (putative c-di-GMP-specific phosphodiesterase class I)
VAQGYYFGKPMPADAATALLRRKAPAQADAS